MSQLALLGGHPVIETSFPHWPIFDQSEIEAVQSVVHSGHWGGTNPVIVTLESAFATFQGTRHALAVTNGSQTMEIILRALGIGPGDEVIVPAYTFIATATAVLMTGATPIIVDINADTITLDPEAFRAAITPRTKAVMPVHIAGVTGLIDQILTIAREHHIAVIEDCAHAHGAESNGRRTGSLGIAGSFSFQGGKVVTAGEGGMIVTNDTPLYEKCWSLREEGRSYSSSTPDIRQVGSNYRLTAFQAAIAQVQLQRFTTQIPQRLNSIEILDKGLSQIPGITPQYRAPKDKAPGYLYLFYYDSEAFNGLPPHLFMKALQAEGVPCGRSGYPPMHKTPLFQNRAFGAGGGCLTQDRKGDYLPDYASLSLPNVERVAREVVCLPHTTLLGTPDQIQGIVEAIHKIQKQSYTLIRPVNTLVLQTVIFGQKLSSKLIAARS
ncbi:MAG: DegT/DnrJ/EryC1/StrS family aminotransferase [Kovacikia sp.]